MRTYDERRVSEEHKLALEEYIKTISNPFDIPVDFVLLDAKENGLTSPVLSGESLYVAGKVEKKPYADVAFGYSFEKLVLYARMEAIMRRVSDTGDSVKEILSFDDDRLRSCYDELSRLSDLINDLELLETAESDGLWL